MLAQNFKTATDLGIEDKQLEALIGVLGLLERGEAKHVKHHADAHLRGSGFSGNFNMAHWCAEADCGTICCIGGTAQELYGVNFDLYENPALDHLFFANRDWDILSRITVPQAAFALRSYLTTGHANWREALRT